MWKNYTKTKAVLLFFVASNLLAQNKLPKTNPETIYQNALLLYKLDNPTEASDSLALKQFTEASILFEKVGNKNKLANCLIKIGTIHQTYQNFTSAKQSYQRALQINAADPSIAYESYLYMGTVYYFTHIIDSAQYFLEKASKVDLDNSNNSFDNKEQLYNSLGAIYFEAADYTLAQTFFEKALLSYPVKNDESYFIIESNVVNCYQQLQQYDKAINAYQKLLESIKKSKNTFNTYAQPAYIIENKIAQTYFSKGVYDSAIYYYDKIIPKEDLFLIRKFNDKARVLSIQKEWKSAELMLDSALQLNTKINGTKKNKYRCQTFYNKAKIAQRQGLIDEAISWNSNALSENFLVEKVESEMDLPTDVTQCISPITLFDALQQRGELLYEKYLLQGNEKYLTGCITANKAAISTASYIKGSFDNDEARVFFNNLSNRFFQNAVEKAFLHYQKRKTQESASEVFNIMENYKGSILVNKTFDIDKNTTVPKELLKKEQDLKFLISYYSTQLSESKELSSSQTNNNMLKEKRLELSRVQQQMNKFSNKTNSEKTGKNIQYQINDIQQTLSSDLAIINYMFTEDGLLSFALHSNGYQIKKVILDTTFYKNCKTYITNTYDPVEGIRYNSYAQSYYLYEKIITPQQSILQNKKKWILFPDGILNYIPIETLITKTDSRDYLVNQHVISYHYSYTLLNYAQQTNPIISNSKKVIFAPFVASDSVIVNAQIPILQNSKKETEFNNLWDKKLIGVAAQKDSFIKLASLYNTIHIATHAAVSNDSNTSTWIQFYPSSKRNTETRVYLPEIYNLNLSNNSLVILSACETATGEAITGEGLLSLSRAFLYAGSKGVLASLWKSNDEVSAYLTNQFHQYIHKGYDASEALTKAKRALLQDNKIPMQFKSPSYWGNFIYTGSVTYNSKKYAHWWWWLLLAILPLYWLYKKRS